MPTIRRIVLGITLNGLALYLVTYFLDDVSAQGGLVFFIIGGTIIGLLNWLIKPILKTLAIPLIFLTGGLILIVINTLLLWIAKEIIVILQIPGIAFEISGTINYLIAGLLFGVLNWLEHLIISNR
jgi:putative membrane protein